LIDALQRSLALPSGDSNRATGGVGPSGEKMSFATAAFDGIASVG
jgi:hypothetical protein